MPRIKPQMLQDFVCDIFKAAGCSADESARIGKYLVNANLAGHDSHGVQRVPRYVEWKREGMIQPGQVAEKLVDTPVMAVLDGKYGFGQTVAPQAVALGIEKCKAMGISAIALRNSGHVGRLGDWAEMAAAEGLISIHFVNVVGSVLVAPFGAVDRRFSTAPYCIGVPRADGDPIILDFATSFVAEGKVLDASFGGKKLPENALVTADGQMSADPHVLYGDYSGEEPRLYKKGTGAIRAFGDHKGSGLALMCELLGGALSGNGAAQHDKRFSNGMFSIYADPAKFDTDHLFGDEVSRLVGFVKSAKPVKAGQDVLVPGEPEMRARAERNEKGVPLPRDTWAALVATARSVGIDSNRLQSIEVIED